MPRRLFSLLERPTEYQQSLFTYMDQAKPILDKRIGQYPKVLVGHLDHDLIRFYGVTLARIATNDEDGQERYKKVYAVNLTRTGKGIRITSIKDVDFSRSKAIILGSEDVETLFPELAQLRLTFELQGVLYVIPNNDGRIVNHAYVSRDNKLLFNEEGTEAST